MVVALLAGTARSASAESIVNGNFELGNVGFETTYTFGRLVQDPGSMIYDLVMDPALSHPSAASYGDHTTGSGLMFAVNGSDRFQLPFLWRQTVPVIPFTDYDFSVWVSTWFPANPAQLDFIFNGQSIGMFTAPSETAVWQEFAKSWHSGANNSATITIIDRNTQRFGNDFALDDISLRPSGSGNVIPEPASLLLFALGFVGLAVYGLRRRATAKYLSCH